MSIALLKQMRSALAALQAQVLRYEQAIEVVEKEAAVVSDGTFKGAFERKKAVKRRGPGRKNNPKPVMQASPSGMSKRGAVKGFLEAHADLSKSPTEESKRLLPLAKAAGIPTTRGSLAVGITKLRQGTPQNAELLAATVKHVADFGPMPYKTFVDWFSEAYPKEFDGRNRLPANILASLKDAGKVRLTVDGWWEAVAAVEELAAV